MKKLITVVIVILIIAAAVAGAFYYRRKAPEPQVTTVEVSRGDIVQTVGATGTLEAVQTVQVGAQVSGIIRELHADFNKIVKKGQLLAKIDPSMIETQIEQAKANLIRSQADLERLKVSLEDAQIKLKRTRELASRKLLPQSELDAQESSVRQIEAQIRSSQAAVTQSQASLNQNMVNLEHTVIFSPIDGIVISRNVDIGQTVASSFNAPLLFLIAADLTKMQARASVDESDVGLIRPGQPVRFRVDAYPTEEFRGSVTQVRLQPIVTQNVVTYVTVIDVPNPTMRLKPGMTANVTIEIARRENALRIPNAALRFRPTTEVFAAFNQEVPSELQRGVRGEGGRAGGTGAAPGAAAPSPATNAPAVAAATPGGARAGGPPVPGGGREAASPRVSTGTGERPAADAPAGRGAGGGDRPEGERRFAGEGGRSGGGQALSEAERQQRFQERMQSMSPEERQQFMQRMRERGMNPESFMGGQGRSGGGPPQGAGRPAEPRAAVAAQGPQTIDQLFGPLPPVESVGRAWVFANNQFKSVRLRTGITDGTFTELLDDALQPGAKVVTIVDLGTSSTAQRTTTAPFMPGMPGGPRPGGGPGGFPGGGGGQRR